MKKSTKRVLLTILQVVCVVVMLVAAVKIFTTLRERHKSHSYAEHLEQQVVRVVTPTVGTHRPTQDAAPVFDETCPIAVDFDALADTDVVAWLYCADPDVSYAVVQGKDNDQYLHALPDGSYSYAGTPFMDYRNAPDLSDPNTIIYGHNMKDDSMFSAFMNYKEQSYYEAHRRMYLVTPTRAYRIELLAGCITDAASSIYELCGSADERDALLADATANSTFRSDVSVGADDRLVTLSTCSYEFTDARYVLIGRLTEIAPAD